MSYSITCLPHDCLVFLFQHVPGSLKNIALTSKQFRLAARYARIKLLEKAIPKETNHLNRVVLFGTLQCLQYELRPSLDGTEKNGSEKLIKLQSYKPPFLTTNETLAKIYTETMDQTERAAQAARKCLALQV